MEFYIEGIAYFKTYIIVCLSVSEGDYCLFRQDSSASYREAVIIS